MQKLPRLIAPILLALFGLGLGGAAIFSLVLSFRDTGTSIVAPGDTLVTIKKSGNYTLWLESKSMIDGKSVRFPDDLPSETMVKIQKQPEGTVIPYRWTSHGTLESNGTRRITVGEATFPSPGEYQVSITELKEKRYLYLDESKFLRLFFRAMLLGGFGILFLLGGIGWGIYVLVQKSPRAGEFRP